MPRLLPLFALFLLVACAAPAPPPNGRIPELKLVDQTIGTGDIAKSGDRVSVHYTGWLFDKDAPQQRGAKFDSSRDRDEPFTFVLGAGQVIRGWDEGVAGMREGGHRLLLLPPEYGYDQRGVGNVIAPGASLVFEVELLNVHTD